ncbi:hypothetical protein A5697_06125 [Mycobacterium sp. E3251]|nr:hypothetical protein A5697_06125 [Mycobacterium sp. E3251]OBI29975.1 hypothetical protein A5711_23805 [Mycobacterium sp. E2238]OBI30247.1 hypothetical protein A5709_26060 [Mycobacterium sp. E1386]
MVQCDELGSALTDIAGECLRFALANCSLCGRSAAQAIGNRKVLAYLVSRTLGNLYGIAEAGAGHVQIRGCVARDTGRRL